MSDSILMQILEDIQTQIRALDLTDIPDANVLIHKVPRDLEKDLPAVTPFPCVIIAPLGAEGLNPNAGTNLRDQIDYPVQILMLDRDNQSQTLHFDRNLLWRERIRATLHNQRNTGLPQSLRMTVRPTPIIDPGGWTRGTYISGLLVTASTREGRLP